MRDDEVVSAELYSCPTGIHDTFDGQVLICNLLRVGSLLVLFEIAPGTPGLELQDVAHVLVPGRGRNAFGDGISEQTRSRVAVASAFYRYRGLGTIGGRIVCSGYKSPDDRKGQLWSPADATDEVFMGIPEADAMRHTLLALGVLPAVIHVERHSIDTVTNFVRSEREGHFGDSRPVAIVAQRAHLERMLEIIAPRTLRRDYLGVAVPEGDRKDEEGVFPRMISRGILLGIDSNTEDIVQRTEGRASRVWSVAIRFRWLLPKFDEYDVD